MLKILLTLTVLLKVLTIIIAGSSNETDQRTINSVAQAIEQHKHKPASHSSEPMSFAKSDLLYLSELPLEQLLKVKKSIDEIQQVNRHDEEEELRPPPLIQSHQDNHYSSSNQIIDDIGVVVEEEQVRPSVSSTMQSRAIDESNKGGLFNFNGGKLLQSLMGGNSEQQKQIINRKTGWSNGGSGLENPWDQKQSKIQTFFQLSITALAFLAFAGYLLCMIVQAIKAKGTTLLMANNMQNASTSNSLVSTGSVPLRRRRRPITLNGRRRKRNAILLSADNRNDTISSIYAEAMNASPYDSEMYNAMIAIAEGYVKLHYFE